MPVEPGDYGPVEILSGVHKGRIAYYDDDNDSGKKAIVYLDAPFTSDYIEVKHALLERVTQGSPAFEAWKLRFPDLAAQLGVE